MAPQPPRRRGGADRVSEREPTGMDEAALTAELAAMAGDVSGAEAVLAPPSTAASRRRWP